MDCPGSCPTEFLKGQGDLSRKRPDKYAGGWPGVEERITMQNQEQRSKSKGQGEASPGNPGAHENAQEESMSLVQSTGSQVITGPGSCP